jgi:signal peptidase II
MIALLRNKIRNTALISAVFLIIIDRFLKSLAQIYWQENPQEISSFLHLGFFKNQFIAFSLDTIINPLFIIFPILIFLLTYFFYTLKKQRLYEATGLILIIAGAMSNLYDRLLYGYVIDYIDLRYFTVFNVADMMICGGVIFILYTILRKNQV